MSRRRLERLGPGHRRDDFHCGIVVVDALDEAAAGFYAHRGFLAVPEHPLRLYRRMKDIRASQ